MNAPSKAKEARLPPALLAELLRYEPETGRFHWRPRGRHLFKSDRSFAAFATLFEGKEALTSMCADGYLNGAVLGVAVKAHRVAWALATGAWPDADIDHVDGDRSNNRISNLREADRGLNCQNRKARRGSTSGYLGVSLRKKTGKWLAQIGVEGKHMHLGYFDTEEQAFAAYCKAKADLHPFNPVPREAQNGPV